MQITIRSITLSVLASLLLFACGSSPEVRYFSLSPMDSGYRPDTDEAVWLGLGPLRMPEYLNRSQIVTRGAGMEMQVDEYNRWAEPLKVSIHRVVSNDVDYLLDGVIVIAFPFDTTIRNHVDYRLLGDIIRFDADQSGRIVLETQWGINKVGAGIVVRPHRSHYEAQAASVDDAGSVAEAMNRALASFSRDIASQLESKLME